MQQFVVENLLRCPQGADDTLLYDHHAIAEFGSEIQIVRHAEDRPVFVVREITQQVVDVMAMPRIKVGHRFIEEQGGGFLRKRAGQQCTLPFARTQFKNTTIRQILQAGAQNGTLHGGLVRTISPSEQGAVRMTPEEDKPPHVEIKHRCFNLRLHGTKEGAFTRRER